MLNFNSYMLAALNTLSVLDNIPGCIDVDATNVGATVAASVRVRDNETRTFLVNAQGFAAEMIDGQPLTFEQPTWIIEREEVPA